MLRQPTNRIRVLPDFLVIGAQRCGTSSLFKYLAQHPTILRPLRKEIEYFSRRYNEGLPWYRSHFPTNIRKKIQNQFSHSKVCTFEATPDYLFDPNAPSRVAEILRDIQLIVLLRNPIERAFSHYRHMVRLGYENLTFDDAIAAEAERIGQDLERLNRDPSYYYRNYAKFSYVSRGLYADQIKRWLEFFPSEHFLILQSEDLFSEPSRTYDRILKFLQLSSGNAFEFKNFSDTRDPGKLSTGISDSARKHLEEVFERPNRELASLLQQEFHGSDAFNWLCTPVAR